MKHEFSKRFDVNGDFCFEKPENKLKTTFIEKYSI